MDTKKLAMMLAMLDAKIYNYGSHVSWEEVKMIRGVKNKAVIKKALFRTVEKNKLANYKHYSVEIECAQCGKLFIKEELNASDAADIVMPPEGKTLICDECSKNNARKLVTKRKKDLALAEERRDKALKTFLSPDYSFNKNTKYYEKWNALREVMPFNYEVEKVKLIVGALNSLDYKDFLKTPYWDAISSKKRAKADFKCELCGSGGTTNIHHKTYRHHGYEFYYMDDLICLCRNCHEKFHDKIGENYGA